MGHNRVKDFSELLGKNVEVVTKDGVVYIGIVTHYKSNHREEIELSSVYKMEDWPRPLSTPVRIFLDAIGSYRELDPNERHPREILELKKKLKSPYSLV